MAPVPSQVVDAILTSKRVEQQSYRSCMGLLKLADKYSVSRLEAACRKALSFTAAPSYKSIKNILDTGSDLLEASGQSSNRQPYRTGKEQPCAYKRRRLLQEVRNHDHTKHDR